MPSGDCLELSRAKDWECTTLLPFPYLALPYHVNVPAHTALQTAWCFSNTQSRNSKRPFTTFLLFPPETILKPKNYSNKAYSLLISTEGTVWSGIRRDKSIDDTSSRAHLVPKFKMQSAWLVERDALQPKGWFSQSLRLLRHFTGSLLAGAHTVCRTGDALLPRPCGRVKHSWICGELLTGSDSAFAVWQY